MSFIRPVSWTRQPQTVVAAAPGIDLIAYPSGVFKSNAASRIVTPYGIGLASATDNAVQLPVNSAIQSASTVTVQALLYVNGTPSSLSFTRIFGTRGTTEGSGNRRGWEIGLDGGSLASALIQTFDSASNRAQGAADFAYNGTTDIVGKLLLLTCTVAITSNTVATLYLKVLDKSETTATATSTGIAATGVISTNVPEICGKMAASTTEAVFTVLGLAARVGTLSASQRQAWYQNPWQLFAPITRRIWVPQTAAGGDTSITPSSGALALTGYAPTAVTPLSAAPSTGQLVIGGYTPSVTSTLSAEPSAGALTLTGYAPTAVATLSASPSAGVLTLTGYAPTALTSLSVSPTTGQLVLTGAAPTATVSLSAAPSAGALTLSGYSPSITVGAPTISISPDTGQIVITGYAPTISGWDTAITPGVGALVIAGYAPTYSGATTIISPATGALSLAGYAPTADTTGPVDISIGVGALLLTGYIPTISNSGDFWRIIDTAQSPSWSTIGTTQSANWQIINTH